MDLQITITLSDQLFKLLEDKLPNLGRRVESALTKELGRKLRSESEISVTASPTLPATAAAGKKTGRRRTPKGKAAPQPETAEVNGTDENGETKKI